MECFLNGILGENILFEVRIEGSYLFGCNFGFWDMCSFGFE